MRKIFFVFLCTAITFLIPLKAESRGLSHWYMSLGMGKEAINNESSDFLNLESSYTAGLSLGHAFCFNNYSGSIIHAFFDWTLLDLKLSDYSKDFMAKYGVGKSYLYNLDIGTFFGPRISIGNVNRLNINMFAKYAPTFFNFINGELKQYDWGFAHQVAAGVDVCYRKVSLGVEWRKMYMDCDFILKDDYANTTEYEASITKTQRLNIYMRLIF